MPKTLGLMISEVIWANCPGVTDGDPEAAVEAAAQVAGVLGCLVALAVLDNKELEKDLRTKIDDTIGKVAGDIRAKAKGVARVGHC